jgi:hypothetical protein
LRACKTETGSEPHESETNASRNFAEVNEDFPRAGGVLVGHFVLVLFHVKRFLKTAPRDSGFVSDSKWFSVPSVAQARQTRKARLASSKDAT